MRASEDLSPRERETIEVADAIHRTGRLHPLIDLLRGADGGPERARDVLSTLGELDLEMLVQIALDTLIDDHITDPQLARQTRRAVRDAV